MSLSCFIGSKNLFAFSKNVIIVRGKLGCFFDSMSSKIEVYWFLKKRKEKTSPNCIFLDWLTSRFNQSRTLLFVKFDDYNVRFRCVFEYDFALLQKFHRSCVAYLWFFVVLFCNSLYQNHSFEHNNLFLLYRHILDCKIRNDFCTLRDRQ